MKWITHQTGSIALGVALNLSPLAIFACFTGAIVPDLIDQKISGVASSPKKRQKIFNQIHRGSSHWFGWWLLIFFLILMFVPPLCRDILAGIILGAISHIILDFLTVRGVPLFPFSKKFNIALPICSTGKISEYIFLVIMSLILVFLVYFQYSFNFLQLLNIK